MTLALTITDKGLAELISAKNSGLKGNLKWVSAGDKAYNPSRSQSKLYNELQRVEISEYVDLGPTSLKCVAKFSGDTEFEMKEIGFWLDSGTLLGVVSAPNTTLNYKSASGHVIQPFTIDLSVLPTDSLEVIVGIENLNIIIDKEMMADATAFIRSQRTQTNMSLAFMKQEDRIKALETSNV